MDHSKNRSSNGTYANFLILKDVLEVNFHPDITLDETVLNQVEMEKDAFMLAHTSLPVLYDISHVKRIQLEGSILLKDSIRQMAVYLGHQGQSNHVDRIREIYDIDKALFKVFQDKDAARDWLNQSSVNS